ncbi:RagB/SusD family nutrient uptake outer membrane protein [Parafilimonas sp.]|uniref:RagB/SusD family nutrient uptake outer membrane protein n=1 Tax=Parafilimonas sp. TaxID=1969739 RepID=UPI0039E6F5F6
MKKLLYLISTIAILLSSCSKDFLKTDPHTYTEAVYWKSATDAEEGLAGAYSPLQGEEALGGEEWCGMEAFSDIGYLNDNSYTDFLSMAEFRATQNNEGDLSLNAYKEYYQTIKRANDVLVNVPDISMDEDEKQRILGEANFLIGYCYFTLVRRYGGVPLYDPENVDASVSVRATEDETWAAIETALTAATEQLSYTHDQGRPGLGAAYGLLAKVYAYEEKWDEAKTAAEVVINSGEHDLYAVYSDLFSLDHENTTEHLWSLGARYGTYPITPILYLPNNVWNGNHSESLGAGWRLVSATNLFYDSYEDGDVRKKATVAKRDVDTVTYNGYTDILQAPNNLSDVVCVKFMQPYEDGYTDWTAGLDVPALRYADVLLIDAEAIMNLNGGGPDNRTVGVPAAAESFNKVRERAGLSAIASPTFNDLMYEREMELAFEGGDRHFDLVRWGLAAEIYNSISAEGTYKPARTFVSPKNDLLPYPQNEIDVSGGTITQNPGYN